MGDLLHRAMLRRLEKQAACKAHASSRKGKPKTEKKSAQKTAQDDAVAASNADRSGFRLGRDIARNAQGIAPQVLMTDPPPPERGTAWTEGVWSEPTTVEESRARFAERNARDLARERGRDARDRGVLQSRDVRDTAQQVASSSPAPAPSVKPPPQQVKQIRKQAARVLKDLAVGEKTADVTTGLAAMGMPLWAMLSAPSGERAETFGRHMLGGALGAGGGGALGYGLARATGKSRGAGALIGALLGGMTGRGVAVSRGSEDRDRRRLALLQEKYSSELRKQAASVLLEKVAILQPNVQDYYMAMGGPLGALKAPPGQRLSTALGSGAGMAGGYYAGKAVERAMLDRMAGRSGKAGKALSLLSKFPIFLSTGLGSVLGARAGQSM